MKQIFTTLILFSYVFIFILSVSSITIKNRVIKLERQCPPCPHVLSDTTIYLSNGKADTMVVKRILH